MAYVLPRLPNGLQPPGCARTPEFGSSRLGPGPGLERLRGIPGAWAEAQRLRGAFLVADPQSWGTNN